MNTDHRLLSHRHGTQGAGNSAWTHALIWVLLAVAALLLVGFTAVVDDITQRGELRRAQQRTSGSLLVPDELSSPSVDVVRLLSMTGEKLAGR
jgi:hypothetical protein